MDPKRELKTWSRLAQTEMVETYRADAKAIATIDAEAAREISLYCDALARLRDYFKTRVDKK